MPTYEFRCPNGHDFERFFKTISAAPSEVACPDCGATASRRLSGGAGLLFKGSGFYLTDYGKNAHRKAAPEKKKSEGKADSGASDSGGTPDSGARTEPKGDTKPTDSGKADTPKPTTGTKPKTE